MGHLDDVWLEDCHYVVRPAGRQKVLSTNRKNVHAFISGELIQPLSIRGGTEVRYNPFFYGHFFDCEHTPVDDSAYAHLSDRVIGYFCNQSSRDRLHPELSQTLYADSPVAFPASQPSQ